MTYVLGLTGSIGMGKSTTAQMFRDLGCPVHDADAEVHALYAGEAVAPVAALFPDVVVDGRIDRTRLGRYVLGHPENLSRLEAVIHPLVRARENAFLARARAEHRQLAVLDVPLLFETGGAEHCDGVLVVTAPSDIQRSRVLSRPGMTEQRFGDILARQMPDADKRARATFVVDTSQGMDIARRQVEAIVRQLSDAGRLLSPEDKP